MSIESVVLYRYALAFAEPLPLKGRPLEQRTGLILEITNTEGRAAHGEIAPLPGFSAESLEEAQRQVIHLVESAPEGALEEKFKQFDLRDWYRLAPSVRCGCSMAMRAHMANEAGEPIYAWLGGKHHDQVPLCALLMGPPDAMLRKAAQIREAGYRTVKVKVGRGGVEADIRLVRALGDLLGPDVALRLDANQAWDLDTAVRFAQAVRGCTVDYIEEPLQDPQLLPAFARQTGLPFAVDESLAPVLGLFFDVACGTLSRGYLDAYRGGALSDRDRITEVLQAAKTVVVKPTLVGEYGRLVRMSRELHGHGLQWVISSSFESGLGLAALARLAACMNETGVPVGLDTYQLLAEDVLGAPFAPGGAQLDLASVDAVSLPLDGSKLTEVYRA